jgi:hypothetical protein
MAAAQYLLSDVGVARATPTSLNTVVPLERCEQAQRLP